MAFYGKHYKLYIIINKVFTELCLLISAFYYITVTVHGVPGTRRQGTAVKHFIWKHRDRWRTGTHTKMTLRLDTEAGKHMALKGETKLGN